MPNAYQFLVKKDRQGAAPAVEDDYTRDKLAGKMVVRDELAGQYLVFADVDDFRRWYAGQEERACHEVVFGNSPQRLKFDIDAPSHKLDAVPDAVLYASQVVNERIDCSDLVCDLLGETPTPADIPSAAPAARAPLSHAGKIAIVMELLIEAILDELYVGFYGIEDLYPSRDDLVVTESHGPIHGGHKYSYHVLTLPYFVVDNDEAREFTARVLERLPEPVRAFVDPDVNKRIQNFRLRGSAKPGTRRYKEVCRQFGTAAVSGDDLLLVAAPAGAPVLPRVYTDPTVKKRVARTILTRHDPIVKSALELAEAAGALKGHAFSECRGTLLCFTRTAPSYCRICAEIHHRDNSLLLGIEPVEAGHDGVWPGTGKLTCRVVEHCRQARGRGQLVGELTCRAEDMRAAHTPAAGRKKAAGGKAPLGAAERLTAHIAGINAGRLNPHEPTLFEALPSRTVYQEPAMRDYELVPTLAVAAQMKLGKTKALRRYLDTHFAADGLVTSVVRFVTFRQTFSQSIANAFPDFVLYSDVQGDLDGVRHPRLIVQVESLHRLKMGARPDPVDLLVLDEVESILAQFNSGLHKQLTASFAMFQWMLATARHVVCMDANLSDRTYRTLLQMRPEHPAHFHWNRYARAAQDRYLFTTDQGSWLEKLHSCVRAGQRVVLPSNSLLEAKAFEAGLLAEFPQLRVMLYSSETTVSEKAKHFADVHTYWSELDVLIYTPTCSAGVSYELEHFDVLFGYFCDISCDVETCRQMLGRVRNIGTGEHYICLRAAGASLPETVDDIRRLMVDRRAGLYRQVDNAALQYSYQENGDIYYYESNYFHLWLENVCMVNISRNNFLKRFVNQVADSGAAVAELPGSPHGAGLLAAHKDEKSGIKQEHSAAVAAAEVISIDEAAALRDAMQAQQDVPAPKRLAYERYQLSDFYSWHGRPMSADFVADYLPAPARRVYRNLIAITAKATVEASLAEMQAAELNHYEFMMETRLPGKAFINECRDLIRERALYVFNSHRYAIWLLRLCGFASIIDKAPQHESEIEMRFRAAMPLLRQEIDRIIFEFEIRRPHLDSLAREQERPAFLRRIFAMVNPVLRMMYGVQVRRASKHAGGDSYYLEPDKNGRLFIFSDTPDPDDTECGPRPHICSALVRPPVDKHGKARMYLTREFYAMPADEKESSLDED